jgi:hypothetical protein
MRKTIKKLLEDGVLISKSSLHDMETVFEANPDLEVDVIKIHKLSRRKRYDVKWEDISLAGKEKIYYEIGVPDTERVENLLSAIDKLGLKSKNLMVVLEALYDCSFTFYNPKSSSNKEQEVKLCLK